MFFYQLKTGARFRFQVDAGSWFSRAAQAVYIKTSANGARPEQERTEAYVHPHRIVETA